MAQELNLPYCLSTAVNNAIEAVVAANGNGPRFFQLYMPHDDELTISLLTRAENAVSRLTFSQPIPGDCAAGTTTSQRTTMLFTAAIGAVSGLSDRVFEKRLRAGGFGLVKLTQQKVGVVWRDSA